MEKKIDPVALTIGAINSQNLIMADSVWREMSSAPKDGEVIEVNYGSLDEPDICDAVWSARPVCMLGNINGGHKPGWATPHGGDTDSNLPLDPPNYWRPQQPLNHDRQ